MPKKSLFVTERDLEIFKFLYKRKVASLEQIRQKFFIRRTKSATYKRLENLCLAGYLKKSGVVFKKRLQVVYSLLEKGFRSLTPRFPYTIHRPILKSDSPAHDLGLGDLWGRLEACQMVESISSENMIQTCEELVDNKVMRVARSLHSDGVVEVDSPKGKFLLAIEYEISDKSASRYTAKLLDYYLATAIPAVLYICGNARIRELIFQADGELGKKFESKVYTCLEENFHANKAAVEFQSYQGDTFYLK